MVYEQLRYNAITMNPEAHRNLKRMKLTVVYICYGFEVEEVQVPPNQLKSHLMSSVGCGGIMKLPRILDRRSKIWAYTAELL